MNIQTIRGASLSTEDRETVSLADQVQAAREYVKHHPALTPVDLAEFETFMRFPKAFTKLVGHSEEAQ
ncbi:hypothetical protein [Aminobacter sp. MDW-2]|uniref:hypothetical protein n=1 Tax=Aminobacter sp. MDW-2 TaxID=2666139 RepID=UPI0012AFFEF7|nr:hypothetical protein [Aminobacter sp. MDW-2]MRX31881.1 hypothetical protein [Aminobacter sp. MDW-2]QNH32357.1 hypothetical protein H5P29_17545 [Aminobacter sp. MDW-2]